MTNFRNQESERKERKGERERERESERESVRERERLMMSKHNSQVMHEVKKIFQNSRRLEDL